MRIVYCMALSAFLMCTSCSENGQNPQEVRLVNENLTEIVVSSDAVSSEKGIEFVAESSWVAMVKPVTTRQSEGSEVDWLHLSQYSGGAGTYMLTLTIEPNITGQFRMAEIVIQCGETIITILIKQEGDATVGNLKPIKQIKYTETDASGNVQKSDSYLLTFSYDTKGKVTKVVQKWEEPSVSERVLTYTYGVKEIEVREKMYPSENIYRVLLNENGLAVEIQEDYSQPYIGFEYTEDGRLSRIKDLAAGFENQEYVFSYENGLLSQYDHRRIGTEGEPVCIDMNQAYVHQYPNNGKIDLMGYLMDDDDFDFLFYIGRLGKTGDYMIEALENNMVIPDRAMDIYDEPNVIVHQSYDVLESLDEPLSYLYEYDKDNYMTKLICRMYVLKTHIEYDAVVGNELIDPENPEIGYVYSVKNRTESPKERVYEQEMFEISY